MWRNIVSGAAGALVATLAVFAVSQITDWFTTYIGPNHPEDAVVSFELESCPKELGWQEYTRARGMFIRGHDPKGKRKLGTAQEDSIRRHDRGYQGGAAVGTTTAEDGSERRGVWHDGDFKQTNARRTSAEGGGEIRPANIALLYCVKRGREAEAPAQRFCTSHSRRAFQKVRAQPRQRA